MNCTVKLKRPAIMTNYFGANAEGRAADLADEVRSLKKRLEIRSSGTEDANNTEVQLVKINYGLHSWPPKVYFHLI